MAGISGRAGAAQLYVQNTASATDQVTITGGIGDVAIGVRGSSANSSVSIGGKGSAGVKLRDGATGLKIQINTTGLGFFAATPVARQTAPVALAVDGSATNAAMAAAINTLGTNLKNYGLFQ